MKKLLSVFLTVLMCFQCTMANTVFAEDLPINETGLSGKMDVHVVNVEGLTPVSYDASEQATAVQENATEYSAPEASKPVEEPKTEEAPEASEPVEEPKTEEAPEADEPVEEPKTEDAPEASEPVEEPKTEDAPEADEPVEEPKTEEAPEADEPVEEPKAEEAPEADEPTDGEEAVEPQANEDAEEKKLITDRPEQSEQVDTSLGDPNQTNTGIEDMPENYTIFVDENGVYQLTYKITDEYDDDDEKNQNVTIDLTKALEALTAYAALTDSGILEPGDSRVFEIYITSESGHTYKYTDGSFVLTTPELETTGDEEPKDVTGFDGQQLTDEYLGRDQFDLSYKSEPIAQILVDLGFASRADINGGFFRRLNKTQTQKLTDYLTQNYGGADIYEGLQNYLVSYYSEQDQVEYADYKAMISSSNAAQRELFSGLGSSFNLNLNGQYVRLPLDPSQHYNNYYQNLMNFVYGDQEEIDRATGGQTGVTTVTKSTYSITDHDEDGNVIGAYDKCYPAKQLGYYYANLMRRYGLPEDTLISIDGDQILFGFMNADGEVATASNSQASLTGTYTTTQVEYANPSWASQGMRNTIAEYMKGADSACWEKANALFNEMLSSGITAEEATWQSFMMAFNIDGRLAGNEYQDTMWGWHNTIELERIDGELELSKVDSETNEVIEGSETTFQLWYYKDTDNDGVYTEKDEKYFYTATTDAQGNKAYGFVKYDESRKDLTYTIDTTGGKLNIDYAMLEGMVYYLQEAVAPDEYEIDTTVYIICDEKTAQAAEQMLKDADMDTSAGFAYAGAIDSEKKLNISVVNVKKDQPPEEPEDPEDPDDPQDPGNPGNPDDPDDPDDPENPGVPQEPDVPEEPGYPLTTGLLEIDDYRIPLGGNINMNEGDCFN